jgi:hypothetical protein
MNIDSIFFFLDFCMPVFWATSAFSLAAHEKTSASAPAHFFPLQRPNSTKFYAPPCKNERGSTKDRFYSYLNISNEQNNQYPGLCIRFSHKDETPHHSPCSSHFSTHQSADVIYTGFYPLVVIITQPVQGIIGYSTLGAFYKSNLQTQTPPITEP